MITIDDVRTARSRIAGRVKRTALERSATLSRDLGTNVYLKLELFQRSGSFKPRGAFAQILELPAAARARGVVGVSGGNFAQGLALAARELGIPAIVCMLATSPKASIEATRGYGATVDLAPSFPEVFARAEQYAREGWTLLHPFDRPAQMAGAGTIGLEIVEDLPAVTDVFVSVGGGGLFTGISVAVHASAPRTRVWAVETEGADALGQALRAGKVVQITPTSLAKTLGSPYAAEDALALVQAAPEQYALVSDREAFAAGAYLLKRAKINAELAASCTLAAARRRSGRFTEHDHVVLVICGGNVSLEDWVRHRELLG